MSVDNNIRACLEYHLSILSGMPTIVREQEPYSQNRGTNFLETHFEVTSRRRAANGQGALRRYQGLYTIKIYTQEGKGTGEGLTLAQSIISHFDTDNYITRGSVSLNIDFAESQGSYSDSPFNVTTVQIAWYTYST